MDKETIIKQIGILETELSQDEMTYRQWETMSQKGGSNSGCGVFILGALLCLILPILGIPLVIIGLVMAATNKTGDQNQARAQMQIGQQQIATKRGRLAELRAQLIA